MKYNFVTFFQILTASQEDSTGSSEGSLYLSLVSPPLAGFLLLSL